MLIETYDARTTSGASTPPHPVRLERLEPGFRAKPWGRRDGLPAPPEAQPLGEVVFDAADAGLVVKWLQTSEPLSIQLHPQQEGRKHEWWYVTEARPGSYLYLGLAEPARYEDIIRRARDGSLPEILRRIEPAVGDMFFVEAGTIHALGPGLTVVEVQEPSDVTWRLFDYGRPRELHLDEAMQDAILKPQPVRTLPGRQLALTARSACIAIAEGRGLFGDRPYQHHECWRLDGTLSISAVEPTVLIIAEARNAGTEPAQARRMPQ